MARFALLEAKQQGTLKQTETADRIAELTESALEQLQLNLAAGRSDTLKAYLATMARFHRYSFGNQLLIAFQNPLATHVAGFHAWRKLGRFVKKGEKGITIIAPCVRRVAAVATPIGARQSCGAV